MFRSGIRPGEERLNMSRLFPGKVGAAGGKLTDGKASGGASGGKILSSAPSGGGMASKLGSTPSGVTGKPDTPRYVLGDPEITANIYYKSRNLHNTDTQNYSTDLR